MQLAYSFSSQYCIYLLLVQESLLIASSSRAVRLPSMRGTRKSLEYSNFMMDYVSTVGMQIRSSKNINGTLVKFSPAAAETGHHTQIKGWKVTSGISHLDILPMIIDPYTGKERDIGYVLSLTSWLLYSYQAIWSIWRWWNQFLGIFMYLCSSQALGFWEI